MEEHPTARLEVENVGGIESTAVAIDPGVTVLSGRNATNRTSLLRAIVAALGSDDVSLKADADAGRVALELGGERYTRAFERRDGEVTTGGDPMLESTESADLFAFLLATNDARRAATTDGDLREILLRPVDVDRIEAEIQDLVAERKSLEDRLEELSDLEGELDDERAQRAALREELASVRERREALQDEIADADLDDPGGESDEELEGLLEDLQAARAELADVEGDLETEREAVEALADEREELRAERESLRDPDASGLEADMDRLRDRRGALEDRVEELGTVVEFNQRMLEEASETVETVLGTGGDDVTDRLVDDSLECWTCGSEIGRDDVEETLERLRTLRAETLEELQEVESRLESVQEERRERERTRARREQLSKRLERTEEDLELRRERLDTLADERDAVAERIDDLEARVEERRQADHAELLERHESAGELAVERDRLESRLDEVEASIADLEAALEERPALEERRETVTDRLTGLRTRVERLEREAVEQFNDHMETLLEALGYGNLERVWLERFHEEGTFELHVVRTSGEGTAYEDVVANLSESEREIVGLVFALAGYLTHDLQETVPFVLLDSLEAIDADRIASLVGYFEGVAPYVVVALLEEDAAALDDRYPRITDI